VPGVKVLPTYHPAAVLRQWNLRPIVLADLMKAKREAEFAEIRRPERWALIDPTLAELRQYLLDESGEARPPSGGYYSVDIETAAQMITMVGFAPSRTLSVVVPFMDRRTEDYSYWPDPASERSAWEIVRKVLASPYPKLFQNGLYDIQYLMRAGCTINECLNDTMLLHHSLYPELQKSLGFMGSVYTNEPAWKLMRRRRGDEPEKKDE
jgi:hypothetical protein